MERKDVFEEKFNRQPGLGTCQVINRKKYDSETASLKWKKDTYKDDRSYGVALFQKESGEFFKYETRFATLHNRQWCMPKLTPLTDDEAKNLTEEYAPEEYVDIFGEVEE